MYRNILDLDLDNVPGQISSCVQNALLQLGGFTRASGFKLVVMVGLLLLTCAV
ncbi:hypothetical protein [Pseudomonas sp. BF-R-19]|uniref:hypothetical protein n=1 Tax=Pseudomonas sp. BF-R-19 TaxID=2832397 RepID=UPI001CBDCD14|nr:hypothetical protein [Pseudomonas sp. BF-R-19]